MKLQTHKKFYVRDKKGKTFFKRIHPMTIHHSKLITHNSDFEPQSLELTQYRSTH